MPINRCYVVLPCIPSYIWACGRALTNAHTHSHIHSLTHARARAHTHTHASMRLLCSVSRTLFPSSARENADCPMRAFVRRLPTAPA